MMAHFGYADVVDVFIEEIASTVQDATPEELDATLRRLLVFGDRPDVIGILLDAGVQINHRDEEGRTPLFVAVKYNQINSARYLLERGADVNMGKLNQSSALHLAAKKGNDTMVELLVNAGHQLDITNWGSNTALLIACRFGHRRVIEVLVRKGADVQICNHLGHYPIHYAAFSGDSPSIHILIEHGATPHVRTHLGITPLMLACQRKQCQAVAALAEGSNLQHRESLYGGTAFHWVVASGCRNCCGELLANGADVYQVDNSGRTPLVQAVQSNQPDVLQLLLLQYKQEDFELDTSNACVIHVAAMLGHSHCCRVLCESIMTRHLLNATDSFGDYPIHLAAYHSHLETVRVLLKFISCDELLAQLGSETLNQIESECATKLPVGVDIAPSDPVSRVSSLSLEENMKDKDGTVEQDPAPSCEGGTSLVHDSSSTELESCTKECEGGAKGFSNEQILAICNILSSRRRRSTTSDPNLAMPFKTYSPVKLAMIGMLKSASGAQMVSQMKFDFNTWLDNGPEAFVLKVTSLDLPDWLRRRMRTPWSLRELCRGTLRRNLGFRASEKVLALPLPTALRDFLNMKELGEIHPEDIQIQSSISFENIDVE